MFKNQADMPQQCPPDTASSNNVKPVYRFIEGDVVQEIDFLNHIERNKGYPSGRECEAFALSFFTTLDAAENAAKKFKNLRNKKFVAGKIISECGIHNTRNNHLNLWLYKDIDMLRVFLGEENKSENK